MFFLQQTLYFEHIKNIKGNTSHRLLPRNRVKLATVLRLLVMENGIQYRFLSRLFPYVILAVRLVEISSVVFLDSPLVLLLGVV